MPIMDEAMDRLARWDREAALLHYFQGASHSQVAAALGIRGDAAAQRVSRALKKLRAYLAHRGAALSVSTLASLLATRAAEAVPTGAAASWALGSLELQAESAGAAGAWAIAQGAAKVMTLSALKPLALAACAAVALAGATAAGLAEWSDACRALRVERIDPFPPRYAARSSLPDGVVEYQVNADRDGRSFFVRVGGEVGGFNRERAVGSRV